MSGVAFPTARVASICILLHLFVPDNVRRTVDVLKLSNLKGVGGDPLVPGLPIDIEAAPFSVQGGLRVHVGLVDKYAHASLLSGILFPS